MDDVHSYQLLLATCRSSEDMFVPSNLEYLVALPAAAIKFDVLRLSLNMFCTVGVVKLFTSLPITNDVQLQLPVIALVTDMPAASVTVTITGAAELLVHETLTATPLFALKRPGPETDHEYGANPPQAFICTLVAI